jgi:hypothetical protein
MLVCRAVMDAAHPAMCSRSIVRAILYANFFLFALFVIPTTHHWVDRGFLALKSVNLEEVVGRSMQAWIVVSTIAATVLFGLAFWRNRRAQLSVTSIRLDGILLLTWWIALLGVCAYGFMLGMGA